MAYFLRGYGEALDSGAAHAVRQGIGRLFRRGAEVGLQLIAARGQPGDGNRVVSISDAIKRREAAARHRGFAAFQRNGRTRRKADGIPGAVQQGHRQHVIAAAGAGYLRGGGKLPLAGCGEQGKRARRNRRGPGNGHHGFINFFAALRQSYCKIPCGGGVGRELHTELVLYLPAVAASAFSKVPGAVEPI